MAIYHFRIKSDKKPKGTKISAVQHVKYINREGKFSTPEQWQEKNNFVGNFITTAEIKNLLEGQDAILYNTDDFGSIRNSQRGIEVTQNASEETIAIALKLGFEKAKALLASAGFTLSNANLSDVIVSAFIENKIFDVDVVRACW